MASFFSASVIWLNIFFFGRLAFQFFFFTSCTCSPNASTITSAIAGAAVSPGLWIPAALKKPGTLPGPKMKSPVSDTARSPAKPVMLAPMGRLGISFLAPAMISSMPSGVTEVSSLLHCSRALGPIKVLPWVVAQIRMPLDFSLGQGNTMPFTRAEEAVLSNRIYSPFRGVTVKESSPASFAISSAYTPAALMTNRVRMGPFVVFTMVTAPSSFTKPVTPQLRITSAPFCTAHRAKAMALPKGHMMPAVGAHKAPRAAVRFGSFCSTSSLDKMARPGTPLARPRSSSTCSCCSSASVVATTRLPVHFISRSSSSWS